LRKTDHRPAFWNAPDSEIEFIYAAVEAGWTTPQIAKEVTISFADTLLIARVARSEERDRLRVCEKCRRNIATGKILSPMQFDGDK
jgi:hypothetical protein